MRNFKDASRWRSPSNHLPEISGPVMKRSDSFGQIFEPSHDNVNDFVFPFKFSMSDQHCGLAGKRVESRPDRLVNDEIGNACFIFQGDKGNSFGGAGALPHEDDTSYLDETVVRTFSELSSGHHSTLVEFFPVECQGMLA